MIQSLFDIIVLACNQIAFQHLWLFSFILQIHRMLILRNIFDLCGKNFLAAVSKPHFMCPEEKLEIFFWKKK